MRESLITTEEIKHFMRKDIEYYEILKLLTDIYDSVSSLIDIKIIYSNNDKLINNNSGMYRGFKK